jgi:hypothetical protein
MLWNADLPANELCSAVCDLLDAHHKSPRSGEDVGIATWANLVFDFDGFGQIENCLFCADFGGG